ncbi:MAG: Co2+/Mg2+ efflux protein ApaG [Hyphomicrobiaceae bacterium]
MYEAITEGIRVRVTPQYVDDQSSPDENYYFWSYTVEITNDGPVTVQLMTRAWYITDGRGKEEVVKGPGVVGQTPVIPPGQSFTYTSGCPLSTTSGIMVGSYQMKRQDGRMVDVKIPAFSLDSPFEGRRVN